MCTLIIGYRVLGPGTMLLAANRDEDPRRPSDPPGVLIENPRVVGGRDRLAGGTWLAIRERRAAVAMLNRREGAPPAAGHDPPRRSRGLLTLDVAGVVTNAGGDDDALLARAGLERARRSLTEASYAPFSLAFLSPDACWVLAHDGDGEPSVTQVSAGWHALTHADLDDQSEPRTARLLHELSDWRPSSIQEAERGLIARLAEPGTAGDSGSGGEPAVCIHEGRMVTVSSSLVFITRREARYLHAEGRPCEQPLLDRSSLLAGESPAWEKT